MVLKRTPLSQFINLFALSSEYTGIQIKMIQGTTTFREISI